MYRRSVVSCRLNKNTFLRMMVILCWVAGLSLGIGADRFYGEALQACLLLTPHLRPLLLGSMCVNIFPFLIFACAVVFIPGAAYGLCLVRGFLTGSAIAGVVSCFSGAGLFMCLMLLFSLLLFAPVILWFSLQSIFTEQTGFAKDVFFCLLLGAGICFADHFLIAPLLLEITIF